MPGKPESELDVLDPGSLESLVERPMLSQEGALARQPARPEVGVVEPLTVLDVSVGEQQLPYLGHVFHQRTDLELRGPGCVPEYRDLLLGMRAVDLDVCLEQSRVGEVVVVEEEHERRLRGEQPEVLGGRGPGVLDPEAAEGQVV